MFDHSRAAGQQNLIFSFSKEWFDAYIAWNLNYVTNFPNLHVVSSLLIPSILCTDDSNVRDHWLLSRLVTLKSAFLPGGASPPIASLHTVWLPLHTIQQIYVWLAALVMLQASSKPRSARRGSESSIFPTTDGVPPPVSWLAILSCKDQYIAAVSVVFMRCGTRSKTIRWSCPLVQTQRAPSISRCTI